MGGAVIHPRRRIASWRRPGPIRIVVAIGFAVYACGCRQDAYRELADPTVSDSARVDRLDARLRSLLGFAPRPGALESSLDPVVRGLQAGLPPGAGAPERVEAVARWMDGVVPVPDPDDTDLVPSLAWERRRGGCTSLAWIWCRLGGRLGLDVQPVLLPGHMALRLSDGRLLEPLRGGRERSPAFYDSVFLLARRPGYVLDRPSPSAIPAAMALQCGLLEWKAGRLREARAALELATRLAPGLPEAEGDLGLVLEALGESDSARSRLRRAVGGDPMNTRAARRLARLESRAAAPGPAESGSSEPRAKDSP